MKEHVRLMQSAAYFLRYRIRLVGRKYRRDSRTAVAFWSICWMARSTLWQWASGVVRVICTQRRPRGVARDLQIASESEQRAVTW